MAELVLIPTEHCAQVWTLAEPYIKRAINHSLGLVKIEEMQDGVESGSHQLWIIWNRGKAQCAIVTQIINDTCFIWACGGEAMGEWLPLHTQLEAWAKENGCGDVQFFGRLGWMRAMRKEGYARQLVVMRKEL